MPTRERWTSPPVVAREAAPAWLPVWRFRLLALVLLAVFVWVLYLVVQRVNGANAQDPDFEALAVLVAALR